MTFIIELFYPDPILSPNARSHWRKAYVAKREQKDAAYYATLDAINKDRWHGAFKRAHLTFTFHPPDKRRRDDDNAYCACKAMRDGIAAALGIDDSNFTSTINPMGEKVKGGKVIVRIDAK